MTAPWIDISLPISPDMTVWPGDPPPQLQWNRQFEDGFRSISSVLTMNVHSGTHVDAPLHFTPGAATVDQLPLDPFVGPATVVDVTGVDVVTAEVLDANVPRGTERLLLRTNNSLRRMEVRTGFDTSYVALDTSAAHWVVDAGVQLVGNDFPSIAVYKGDSEIHLALMRAGVGILEGVALEHVEPGEYELVCLPLLLVGAEGAPARVVIRRR